MDDKIKVSKENLENYYLTMILINNSYKNQVFGINKNCEPFLDRFKEYFKCDINDKLYITMFNYVKLSVEYLQMQSAITIMYHLFEQFIKVFFCINMDKDYFTEAKKIVEKYEYNFEDNTYYEIVNKYRLLNNFIKHGGSTELEKNTQN